jgi:hypothetical protein
MHPLYWMHSALPGGGYDSNTVSFAVSHVSPGLPQPSPVVLPLLEPLLVPDELPLVELVPDELPLVDPLLVPDELPLVLPLLLVEPLLLVLPLLLVEPLLLPLVPLPQLADVSFTLVAALKFVASVE